MSSRIERSICSWSASGSSRSSLRSSSGRCQLADRRRHYWNCISDQSASKLCPATRMRGGRRDGGITIVGGGIAGIAAAITCAEAEAEVTLLEAHDDLGGRARSTEGPLQGEPRPARPLQGRPVLPLAPRSRPDARHPRGAAGADPLPLAGRAPAHAAPLATAPAVLRLRGREAPADREFRSWATEHTDERTAQILSAAAGVYTFHHDPGELSAEFIWGRTVRPSSTRRRRRAT